MNRKIILLVTLGLFLIGLGSLFCYLNDTSKDKKELKNKIDIVENSYNKLEKEIEIINGEREIINEEVLNNLYDENISKDYDNWIKKLDSYKNSLKNVKNLKNRIKKYCVKNTFEDSNVISKCESMINGYETIINYYVKDINYFNEFVEEFNKNYPDNTFNVYISDYNFIDINNDGKYLGK